MPQPLVAAIPAAATSGATAAPARAEAPDATTGITRTSRLRDHSNGPWEGLGTPKARIAVVNAALGAHGSSPLLHAGGWRSGEDPRGGGLTGTTRFGASTRGAARDDLREGAQGGNVEGGTDDDSIHGRFGNDWLRGNEGNDVIAGGFGTDDCGGSAGSDELQGRNP